MAFASLTIDLNARLANIEKDLGRSVHMAEKSAQKMQAAFAGVGKVFAGLASGVAVGQFVSAIKGVIDSADGLNDLATRTGTSVESLASLQLAAKLADTDLQNLGAGLGKLSIFMANNAEEAQALGITARDPVEAFAQLADVIGATADPAERNALAMSVLGKSYAELMPLLAQGGDALRDQAAASGPYAERMAKLSEGAAKFNDTLDELAQVGQASLIPLAIAFTDFASAALDAAEGVEGFDKALAGLGQAGVVGQTIAVLWANVAFVFKGVGTEIGGIAAQLAAIASGDFKGAGAISQMMKDDAEKARAELAKLEDRILNFKAEPKLAGIGSNAYAGDSTVIDFIKEQEATIKELGRFDPDSFVSDDDAKKLQDNLRKAFDLKPLDDFIDSFRGKRQSVEKEYKQLLSKLTGPSIEGAKGGDIALEISQGQGALSRGDQSGAEVAIERGRQMLEGLKNNGGADFELRHYTDQLKQLELSMLDSQQTVAEETRASMLDNINTLAEEVSKMDPMHIPIATEAIANDMKATLDRIRQDLANDPLVVPVVVQRKNGIYGDSNLSDAATKHGGRA